FQIVEFADQPAQRSHRRGDVLEERLIAFDQRGKTVEAERLHQALNAAQTKDFAEVWRHGMAGGRTLSFVIRQQLLTFRAREADVWIEKQRGQIVLRQAWPHSLEVDQVRLRVANDDVLRLEITMDHDARKISKTLRDLLQGRQRGKLRKFFLIHAKMTTEAVLEEIVLLPAIEDRKSTRLNSSHLGISYAVFCLKKKTI